VGILYLLDLKDLEIEEEEEDGIITEAEIEEEEEDGIITEVEIEEEEEDLDLVIVMMGKNVFQLGFPMNITGELYGYYFSSC
tara:strand:- start:386 stop:631 length:246 start_codon:yes stop_codon:yes gene_type:complete